MRRRRIYGDHEFEKALRLAEQELRAIDQKAKERSDRAVRHEVAIRRRQIAEIEKELRSRELLVEKVLFISYSGASKREFARAKAIGRDMGFQVTSGLDLDVELSWHLRNAIIRKIGECAVFLGIWADDFSVRNNKMLDLRNNALQEIEGSGPSVWLPLELGVALAEKKPFQLLIKEGTHPFYYEKPVPELPHSIYGIDNFEDKVRGAINKLLDRYNELIGEAENSASNNAY